MIRQSIKRKIVSIAVGLVVLMVVTSALSMVMAGRVARQLDELTTKYVEAYAHLARMNVRSLERSLAIRRMIIAKMQTPPDEAGYADRLKSFAATGPGKPACGWLGWRVASRSEVAWKAFFRISPTICS